MHFSIFFLKMLFAVKTHFNQLPFQWKVSVDGDSYFFHTGDA